MERLVKILKLNNDDYFIQHLAIVNSVLPVKLTPKEIEVLGTFMSFTGELGERRFEATARKIVMDKLGLSPGGLSNYLKSLKDKGFVKNNEILDILFPEKEEQIIVFKLINKDGDK